ncbi:hypothetical protein V1264_010491 [Littorina saxatilis]|uniref:Uncharacterized protein n=1 Tax=Littorina saxatilis TaxID=31220 RepID=A0AAN9APH8_9CAEN
MDDDSDSDYVAIVEQPSPTVVDVSDDEDPVASNDNFGTYAKQGSVSAPVSESSTRCDKSKTDSDTIHDVFHSRMEQFLSSSKSHQSVSDIVVSGRVMKKKVVSYLILDSDSDFSDVEVCDGTSEIDTNKGAKISESASEPASNILRTLANNVTPGPASVAGKPQESSKKSLSTESSSVEETVAPHKEIVRYSADHSARRGHQNDGYCIRMGSDEETVFSSNLAKESDDEHRPQEQSGELLDLEFDVEVAEDFSEHEAEESNSCDTSSRGGHCDYEGDVLDSEELACLAYTAGHSPNFDGVTGSSGIQPLAISITEKSNKDLQAQSFRGCRTVASKELGQAVAGQKRRSNVKTHPVSCQPPTKFSRTGFTDIDRDFTKLPAVATDTAGRPSHACQEGTVRLSSSLIATSATFVLEGLSSPSALTNTGWEAQHPVRPMLLVKSSDKGVISINNVSEAFKLNPAIPQTNVYTEGVVFSSSIHKAESQGPQLQLSPHLLQSQTNAPTDLVDGPPDTDCIIRLGVDKVQSPASELIDDGASNNNAVDHAWHLGISPGGDQEEGAFDQTDEVAVDTVVKRKPQSFDCAFHMQDELVDAESEMPETFSLDVTTLNDPEFQRCLTEPVPSKKMSSFLLRAQNAKFKVCHDCGEEVLNKPCLLWGKNKVVTTNVNGVLMVTIAELARMGFIDYHIAKHKLLDKKEFPAVWSYVIDKSNERKAVLGVSLVFVVLVVNDTLTLHQYLPKRRRMLMKKGLKTPFKLVGKLYLPFHLEEPQKTHLLTNSTYTCSYITCTAVRAKRMSSRTASFQFPLFTNSSLNRDRNECLFLHAMDRVLYNSETRLIRKGSFVPSLGLMYPPCPCQEVSKLDVTEREAWKSFQSGWPPMSSLQVLRFMGCNVFCFNEDDAGSQYMHVSVAELQHRELLPAQLGTNFFQDSNLLHETGDIRFLNEKERMFLTQYFNMTCDNSIPQGNKLWYACTPFALQQLYQELSKTHYKYDQHSKALFYIMTLGHQCYWSLQVQWNPPFKTPN